MVIDGSIGNIDASGWPLEIELSEKIGVLVPLGLVEVDWKVCEILSWKTCGNKLTISTCSRHNSKIV